MQRSCKAKIAGSNPVRGSKRKTLWEIWARALGEKAHNENKIADHIAIIRTTIFAMYFITNFFIVAGVIRHWNDAH